MQLNPMSEADFAAYLDTSIASYAAEHIKAGGWTEEEGLEKAKQSFDRLLPNGVNSPNQHLFSLYDENTGETVGMIWLAVEGNPNKTYGYIYDVVVDEAHRRKGYGEQAFRLIEEKARELGQSEIRLHVFGHNHGARALYEKLGYITTNLMMKKEL